MIKSINSMPKQGLAGTINVRADLKSAAFSEFLSNAEIKSWEKITSPISRISSHTVDNIVTLFTSVPNKTVIPRVQTKQTTDMLSFEQQTTLVESTKLLQTRLNYLKTALQIQNPAKSLNVSALLKL